MSRNLCDVEKTCLSRYSTGDVDDDVDVDDGKDNSNTDVDNDDDDSRWGLAPPSAFAR